MIRLRRSLEEILRAVAIVLLPWAPAFFFERIEFSFLVTANGSLYGQYTGVRMFVDIASFALAGIVMAFILRPRWAIIQAFLSTVFFWFLLYVGCQTVFARGRLLSECYQTGPDGLAGYRMMLLLFSLAALPTLVKVAEGSHKFGRWLRPGVTVFAGIILSVVMQWNALSSWFAGVTYLPPLNVLQAPMLVGVPLMATGILAARIGRSLKISVTAGVLSLLFVSISFWSLSCPNCDRTLVYLMVPGWAFFALLGGLTELGIHRKSKIQLPSEWLRSLRTEDFRRVAIAAAITVCLTSLYFQQYWDPNVLYATPISPGPGATTYGLPSYPYVAGYYDSLQYRICCLQVGVSFVSADTRLLGSDNFVMAGMGVQSPNCCVDGWDLGWRADVFLMPDKSMVVSASSWGTCDTNPNCGGHFWQDPRYHSQVTIRPANPSTPIYLRMMWESGRVNWYFNTTGTPWQQYGSFTPDSREGQYFDIGRVGGGPIANLPQRWSYFYQFGVASKIPVKGWTVQLLYPSFVPSSQPQGAPWRVMEKAVAIQGDYAYWKLNYRWGGRPYPGVTAMANSLDPSFTSGVLQLAYTGGDLPDNEPLW